MNRTQHLLLAGGLVLAATFAGCANGPAAAPAAPLSAVAAPEVRAALAPTGTLRIGVYPGSPTSMVRVAGSDEMGGLSVELGAELARRLSVPSQVIVYQRVAEVVDALKAGDVDITITNATPARARDVDFTPPLLALELGYLALAGSPVQSLQDVDRPGVRIGVTQGSSSQGALSREFRHARVVPAASLQAAGDMLQQREIDAFATNKAILFELADKVSTARVLEGRWGLEHLAIAIPKGRERGAEYLRDFARAVYSEGLVQSAAVRAGLRGTAAFR